MLKLRFTFITSLGHILARRNPIIRVAISHSRDILARFSSWARDLGLWSDTLGNIRWHWLVIVTCCLCFTIRCNLLLFQMRAIQCLVIIKVDRVRLKAIRWLTLIDGKSHGTSSIRLMARHSTVLLGAVNHNNWPASMRFSRFIRWRWISLRWGPLLTSRELNLLVTKDQGLRRCLVSSITRVRIITGVNFQVICTLTQNTIPTLFIDTIISCNLDLVSIFMITCKYLIYVDIVLRSILMISLPLIAHNSLALTFHVSWMPHCGLCFWRYRTCSSIVFILTISHVFALLLNWFNIVMASDSVNLFHPLYRHFCVHLQLVLICVCIAASNFFHIVDLGDVCHTLWASHLKNVSHALSSHWLSILRLLVAEKNLVLCLSSCELLQGIGKRLTSEHVGLDSRFGLGCCKTLFIDRADRALI